VKEAKIKVLVIGENSNGASTYKELINKKLNSVPVVVDSVSSLEEAFYIFEKGTYDFYVVDSKNGDKEKIMQLKTPCNMEKACYHTYDQLTGLCSRFNFLESIKRLDLNEYFPISFIMGDVNGLKLVNDVFGHNRGDHLLEKVGEIFKKICHKKGIVARWGGDEFAVAMPNTTGTAAAEIVELIRKACEKVKTVPLKLNIALGTSTKEAIGQDILDVLKKAEGEMYSRKIIESKNLRNSVIASLVKTLGEKDYETEEHAWRMQNLAVHFGSALDLSDSQLDDLILTVTLHDIGKIAVPERLLMKKSGLTDEEWTVIKEHSERGYRIALSSSELSSIAPAILSHHERWDGKGYPMGLKEKQIPLLSRIVAIVDSYDVMTNVRPYKKAMGKSEALEELKRSAGTQFDPELVEIFINLNL
jgi:diguanylate cyclase (GGDEF)-like protein